MEENKQEHDNGLPHDAHVKQRHDELRRFSEQLDAHALHDAHVETRRDAMTPKEQSCRREHARDFAAEIKRTTFFKAHPNQQIVMQINAALNDYHDLYAARELHTEQEKAARQKARALIEKLRSTFEEIATNSLASTAVIAAFCQPDKPAGLDERIANLSRAIESLEAPSAKRGRPATPELGRLIQRLAHLVVSSREQAARTAYNKAKEAEEAKSNENETVRREVEAAKRAAAIALKAVKIDDDTAQSYINALLEAGNVHRADDTLQNHLIGSRRQHYLEVASTQAVELEQLTTPIIHPDS